METPPIELTSRFDYDTLRVGHWWHLRKALWGRLLFWLAILYIAGCAVFVLFWCSYPFIKTVPLFLLTGLSISWRWIADWFFRRRLLKVPAYGREIHWKLCEEGFEHQIEGASLTAQWAVIYCSVLTPDGFLIYPQQNIFYWLPRSAFKNFDDFERLAAILKEKTKWKSKS